MGHWILEVAKVALYISFPISSIYFFNLPSFYEPILYNREKEIKKFKALKKRDLETIDTQLYEVLIKQMIQSEKSYNEISEKTN